MANLTMANDTMAILEDEGGGNAVAIGAGIGIPLFCCIWCCCVIPHQMKKMAKEAKAAKEAADKDKAERRARGEVVEDDKPPEWMTKAAEDEKRRAELRKAAGHKSNFIQYVRLAKHENPMLFVALCLSLCTEATSMIMPLLTAAAFQCIYDTGPNATEEETDAASALVIRIFTQVFALTIAQNLIGFFQGLIVSMCGERIVARTRVQLYAHLLKQDMGFFDVHQSGDLISRLGTDTQLIQASAGALNSTILGVVKTVAAVVMMVAISWQMFSIVFGGLWVFTFVFALPIINCIQKITKRYQDALGKAANCSTEALGAMRTIHSFASNGIEFKRYEKHIGTVDKMCARGENTFALGIMRARYGGYLGIASSVFVMGAIHFAMLTGMLLVLQGEMQFGMITAFQQYQMHILMGVGQIVMSVAVVANGLGGAAKIFELFNTKPRINLTGGIKPDQDLTGQVTFEDIHFSYPSRPDVPVLQGFNLSVEPCTKTALVGGSGCGKSTTLGLLLRFYNMDKGKILVDGMDVSEMDTTWLRGQMSLVQQEPVLFGVTIAENVYYGIYARSGKSIIDKDVRAVAMPGIEEFCRQSNAHTFISELVDGYDTLCGERGTSLSGGQKQRIAIARAMLTEPKILLLDEATSALDAESEGVVQDAIDKASVGRTSFVIAHRLSTVIDSDNIVMVVKGVADDCAPHDILLSRCAPYKKLIDRQMGKNKSKGAKKGGRAIVPAQKLPAPAEKDKKGKSLHA